MAIGKTFLYSRSVFDFLVHRLKIEDFYSNTNYGLCTSASAARTHTSALTNSCSISLLGWDAFWHKLMEVPLFRSTKQALCLQGSWQQHRKGGQPERFSGAAKLCYIPCICCCTCCLWKIVTGSVQRTLFHRHVDNLRPSSALFSENVVVNIVQFQVHYNSKILLRKTYIALQMLKTSSDNFTDLPKVVLVSVLQAEAK